jgi:protein phosphatase
VKIIGEVYFADKGRNIEDNLRNAISAANKHIHETSKQDASLAGMGTTCVALVVSGASIYVAHVGDSRAYRITKGEIAQITMDHSVAAELFRRGVISEKEVKHHPEHSVLYRALGTSKNVEIDVQPEHRVKGEERFVLCTDGLSNMVEDNEIRDIVMSQPPEWACDELIRLANERGGRDNITVIILNMSVS